MENIPLVSIFCPTYNHEKFIRQCLEGIVKQQTTFQIEVIIQDDASTDGTSKIINEYAKKYSYIIPRIHDVNIYSLRKNLNEFFYKNARGKYIALCEGDDYWTDPLKLQKQVDFLEANPEYVLSCHLCHYISDNEAISMEEYNDYTYTTYTIDDIIKGNFMTTCSVVFRNPGKFPEYFKHLPIGDWPQYLHLAKKGNIHFINKFMGVYRMHNGGIFSGQKKIDKIRAILNTVNIIIENKEFTEKKLIRKIKTTRANYILQILSLLQLKKEKVAVKICWYFKTLWYMKYYNLNQIKYLLLFPIVTIIKNNSIDEK